MTDQERAIYDEDKRIIRIAMFDDPTTRSLTDEERQIISHVSMFGSDGYPVQKLGRKWITKGSPLVYGTKREAVAAFERYLGMLHDLYAVEMMRKNAAENNA